MTSKEEIESYLKGHVNDRFINLWWGLKLPGLGMQKPVEVYEENPEALLNYVKGYTDESFT